MALDCVFSIAAKIAEYAIEPVGRQFGYLIYYNSNIHALKTQLHKLDMEKVMVVELVDAATRNGEHVLPNVQEWLTSADLISEESKKFFNDQVKQNQKCFSRGFLCPDLVSRYRVSRKSSKKKLEVDELLGEGKFERVSIPAPPPPASSIFAGNAEVFESRASTFKAIMDALEDDEVKVIGVYGMGGIGKTTMVKQVAKEAEQCKLIDEFSMAVVSQKQDVPKIQSDIADLLGLKLDVGSEEARAGHLFKRMNQGKKILLILDDLWTPIDLTAIGIPRGGKYCKIVLTSRDLDVCTGMNCDRFFSINVLPDAEAWSFFRSIAGAAVDAPDLHPIATEIVAKCAGLPIAILTVARALSGKSQHFWTDALHQLRNSTPKNIKGMHGNVYSLLEVSYRSLESDELRYCFLVCCLFKEDVDILMECLVRYGLGLNLFEGVHSVEAARDRAHVLVDYLKARCLLMDGKARHSVTMHDVIRDFAHFLTSNGGEHVFLVRGGAEIIEWPNSNTYNRCTAISLLSHQISELPEGLDCPKLKILIFEHEYPSTELKIPSKCFQETKELRVLKMCYYSIPSIPPSIAFLMNLETLCLECCILGDLSQIGALKKLKVLSLARSMFLELPREIGLLKHLLILDLTGCEELKVVPPNLISSLTQLECLYLLNTFDHWSWGGGNANVRELNHLPHLNTIEMHVSDISLLPKDFLLFQNLKRFRVCLGDLKTWFSSLHRDLDKMLVVPIEPDYNNSLPEGVITLMERSQVLVVKFKGYDLSHPSTLTLSDLNEGGFTTLKYLEVKNNYSMKYLIDSSSSSQVTTGFFPLLEELELAELGLNQICNGDLPEGSFGELRKLKLFHLPNLTNLWYTNESVRYPHLLNLRYVSISNCKELKHAFPQSASGVLGQLWTLSFRDCNSLEGIFLEDRRHKTSDIIHLPKLQSFWFSCVPSLKSFCSQDNEASAAEQQSHTKILLPALEDLDFKDIDQNIHIFLQQLLPESFLNLRVLRLHNCKSIVTAFPSNVPHCLQNLASLTIERCESLETILDADVIPRRQDDCVSLRSELELPREFPSLKTIFILDCPKLKTFAAAASSSSSKMEDSNVPSNINRAGLIPPFFDEKITFPALEVLTLIGVDISKEIWHRHLPPVESFCSLREVRIIGCNNLVTIFPSNLLPKLQNLSRIDIGSCNLLERVSDFNDTTLKFTLPSLQDLLLSYLQNDLIHSFFCGQIVYPTLKFLGLEGIDGLKKIWHPKFLPRQSFHGLKTVSISHCNDLVTIFPSSFLRRLKNLDVIEIINCELVEKVFDFDDENTANVGAMMIPRLKSVNLKFLPKLMCFGQCAAEFPSLKQMEIRECPKMKTFMGTKEHISGGNVILPFFDDKVYMPVLEELTIYGLQDLEDIWHDQLQDESFNQLKVLTVEMCSKLSTVISLRLLLSMKNLDKISVERCESVNEIVKLDNRDPGDQAPVNDAILTRSNLRELKIADLPNLRSFSGSNCILEWPSLSKMVMNNCPYMETFCWGPISTPQLKGLTQSDFFREVLWEGGDLNSIIQHLFKIQRERDGVEKKEEETATAQRTCFGLTEVPDEANFF